MTWICMDCTAECENRDHAWAQAEKVTLEDGSEAWLIAAPENTPEKANVRPAPPPAADPARDADVPT